MKDFPACLKSIIVAYVGCFHTYDDLWEIFYNIVAVLNTNVRPFIFNGISDWEKGDDYLDADLPCCVTNGFEYRYCIDYFTEEPLTLPGFDKSKPPRQEVVYIAPNSSNGTFSYREVLDSIAKIEYGIRYAARYVDEDHVYFDGFHQNEDDTWSAYFSS